VLGPNTRLGHFSPRHGCAPIILEKWLLLAYASRIQQTLEQRLECLEKEFAEFRSQVLGVKERKKDWRSTVGTLEQDGLTTEAERLGREYREQQTYQKEIAGS
jgi:hypothetical protein